MPKPAVSTPSGAATDQAVVDERADQAVDDGPAETELGGDLGRGESLGRGGDQLEHVETAAEGLRGVARGWSGQRWLLPEPRVGFDPSGASGSGSESSSRQQRPFATPVLDRREALGEMVGLADVVVGRPLDQVVASRPRSRARRARWRCASRVRRRRRSSRSAAPASPGSARRSPPRSPREWSIAPLAQPRPQRRVARQPDRPDVGGARVAEVAVVGLPVVRVDGRVDPAHVAHRAVHQERPLLLRPRRSSGAGRARSRAQLLIRRLRSRCAARKVGDELGVERRPVRCVRRVDVQLASTTVGSRLVDDRRVHPLGQGLGAGEVRGDEDHAVGAWRPWPRPRRPGRRPGSAVMVGCSASAW